jgi:hypothetical protein
MIGGLARWVPFRHHGCVSHNLLKMPMRLFLAALVMTVLPMTAAVARTCEIDADCDAGSICQKNLKAPATRPGICQHDPRVPQILLAPQGVAVPRSDRDPSTRVPTNARNPTGYAQCAADRDCPDGFTCTRRNTSESWYCRKR